jgi:hypothetical protein
LEEKMKDKKFLVLLRMLIIGMLFGLVFAGCDQNTASPWESEYAVGEIGPAGGLVFYVSEASFAVDGLAGMFHYLEASPVYVNTYDWDLSNNWGGTGTFCGVTATGIGKGYANTKTLQTHSHENSGHADHPAAKAVGYYSVTKDGILYEDWWLPSRDELNELYKTVAGLSNKSGWDEAKRLFWWSSSEYDANNAWIQFFAPYTVDSHTYSIGEQVYWPKGWEPGVRAVRAF